ncbi:ABC transporter ATP-binding protein [Acuticoccus sediminis]|uniref:ABC transporter ATP-binding protein n=1 Tax=Acuticoccus sediminis TaxID=2184697 RepID=UPI001CFC94D9|nr:ABC transporter ATP-binding protein [Acuticoccus sediminis]
MSDIALKLSGLDVFYGASKILFSIDFEVKKGRTLALLGRNGAGKSTTMKAISGVAPPRSGRVEVHGIDVAGRPPYAIARHGVGYVPEDRQVFPAHTVEENLEIAAKTAEDGSCAWTMARVWEVFPILARLRTRRAGLLSGGEQQLLTMARTLMGNPDILLLDEPSEGLAPIIVQEIGRLIRELRQTGVTIVLAEQNMHFCLGLAEDAVIIDKGHIVYADTIEALRADPAVASRYLAI